MLSVLYTLFMKCNVTLQEASLITPSKTAPIMHSLVPCSVIFKAFSTIIYYFKCLLAYALSSNTKTEVI